MMDKNGRPVDDSVALLVTVAVTTIVWIATTLLTPPVDEKTLDAFYAKVRPAGPGWHRVRARTGAPASPDSLPQSLLCWVLGLAGVYSALFGTGAYLYGHWTQAAVYTAIFVVSAGCLVRFTSGRWSRKAPAAEVPA